LTAETTAVSGISGRYATALFELATESNALGDVEADLGKVKAVLDESAQLRRTIRSPLFRRAEQAAVMDAILDRLEVGDVVKRFIAVVARNRRLFALPEMIRDFGRLAAAERNEVVAHVLSAAALSGEQTDKLKQVLQKAVGQDVSLEADVDEGLIGGLVVRVGSRMIDSSIRTKLQNLKFAMKEVG
jgi:F-type H+-transporting ATPase subunit delta